MEFFNGTLDEVLALTWPTLFISLILVVTLRVGYIIKNKSDFVLYEEIMLLAFMLYILTLFQLVTTQDLNASPGNNLTPFTEIFRYRFGSRLFYKNIVGNIILFIPYGFFASYYLKLKKPFRMIVIALIASFSIEITQFMIGRIFDVDDIILNVFGGLLGFAIYYGLVKLSDAFKIFKSKVFINISTILIFLIFFFFVIRRLLGWEYLMRQVKI